MIIVENIVLWWSVFGCAIFIVVSISRDATPIFFLDTWRRWIFTLLCGVFAFLFCLLMTLGRWLFKQANKFLDRDDA